MVRVVANAIICITSHKGDSISRGKQNYLARIQHYFLQSKEPNILETTQAVTPADERPTPRIEINPGGSIRVIGGLPIYHGQELLETKEKLSLCRCGQSKKKPYCDGSHKEVPGWDVAIG